MSIQTKTLRVRVKDKHAKLLRQMAFEVNQVFNHAIELTMKASRNFSEAGAVKPVWLSAFDIQKMTSGIHSKGAQLHNWFFDCSRNHCHTRKSAQTV
ncbi:hypothetical protein [uncultured Photobacterium sp.]|uniref:hypothetical protein n=1 Tax=uncultured Photobacterium sp. TaxID=173973 RepID=UPI002605022B|nr:hypothetical protein [uncultured Photobacterium sp.]